MKTPSSIRLARPEDAAAIAKVRVVSWQSAYRNIVPDSFLDAMDSAQDEDHWRASLLAGRPTVLVAEAEGTIVGFAAFGDSRDLDALPGTGEIWAIYIDPAYWSKGIGYQLWKETEIGLCRQGFSKVSLWVLSENERAIRFYSHAGFSADEAGPKSFDLAGCPIMEIRFSATLPARPNAQSPPRP